MFKSIVSVLAILGALCIPVAPISAALTGGADFVTDASADDGLNNRWEDIAGAGSGFDFELAASVIFNTGVSQYSGITNAYEFVGGSTGTVDGALLSSANSGTRQSFQGAPGNWSDESVSIELWFRPDNLTPGPANGQILFEDGGGTGFGLVVDDSNLRLRKLPTNGAVNYNLASDPNNLISGVATGEFIQAVAVFNRAPNPDNIQLYVNGSLVGTNSTSNNGNDWSGGDHFGLGTRGQNNVGGFGGGQQATESFDGEMALVRVYRGQVLTATEVRDNFDFITGLADVFSAATGDYDAGGTWDSGAPPISISNAFIGSGHVVTSNSADNAAMSLTVGNDGTGTHTLGGTLNIGGGSLDVINNLQVGGNASGVSNTKGNVTQTAGTVTVGGNLVFGGAAATEGGTYNLRGGTLNVTGDIVETASNVDAAQLLIDGGILTVGGNITVQRFAIADTNGGNNGSYDITAGQEVKSTGTTAIGSGAEGVLNFVGANGKLTSDNAVLGEGSVGSKGTVNIDNNGTWINSSAFTVGSNREGIINVNSGLLDANGGLVLGNAGSGIGRLNIDGGDVDVSGGGGLLVGNNGQGFVDVISGTLDSTKGIKLASGSGTGTMNVGIGGGAPTVNVSGGNTEVGTVGTGSFTLESGTFNQLANNLVIAQGANSQGTVTVNGGTLNIGNFVGGADQDLNMNRGLAVLNHNGGDVNIERDLRLGAVNHANSNSTYNLDAGAGTLDIGRNLNVGEDRVGEFNFESGTFDIGGTIYVGGDLNGSSGANPNSNGTINIGTLGGTPTMNTNQFEVGRHRVGVVNQDGGTVNVNAGNLVVSQLVNSTGTYNLNGGAVNVVNDLNLNQGTGEVNVTGGVMTIDGSINLTNNATGNATLNVAGGTVHVGGNINDNAGTSNLNLSDGTLRMTNNGDITVDNFSMTGGVLINVNEFNGTLTQDGGELHPGGSIGDMTILGNYDMRNDEGDATLVIEYGNGDGNEDHLFVIGNALLNGTIKLTPFGFGIDPLAFDRTIELITADEITFGEDFQFNFGMSEANGHFDVRIVEQPSGQVTLTLTVAVPEPTTAVLGLLGVCGLAGRRRRRA